MSNPNQEQVSNIPRTNDDVNRIPLRTTAPPAVAAALTLPDGRLIDGKNTLQSFVNDHTAAAVSLRRRPVDPEASIAGMRLQVNTTTNTVRTPPVAASTGKNIRLPDGRMIDGKNTLQSFNVASDHHRNGISSGNDHHGGVGGGTVSPAAVLLTTQHNEPVVVATATATGRSNNSNNNNSSNRNTGSTNSGTTIRAEVVTTRPLLVADAEGNDSPPLFHPEPKRSISFWLAMAFAVMLLVIGAGIGVYCGTGNCGSSSSSAASSTTRPTLPPKLVVTSPANPPTRDTIATEQPTTNPIVATRSTNIPTTVTNEQLMVACEFLSYTSLSECQSVTSFLQEDVMGNTIPSEIGLLTRLTSLFLTSNKLTGTIPSTVGNLVQLKLLALSSNQLTGTIPSTLGNLQLTHLQLNDNPQLGGTIPSSLCNGIEIIVDCENLVCSCCRSALYINNGASC